MSILAFSDIEQPDLCFICLEEMNERALGHAGIGALSNKISHVFHSSCLIKWFASCINKGEESTCPICRVILLPKRSISEHIDSTHPEILKELLPRMQISSSDQEFLISLSIENRKFEAAKMLLKHHPLPKASRESLVIFAARKGSKEVLDALYDDGTLSPKEIETLTHQAIMAALDEL